MLWFEEDVWRPLAVRCYSAGTIVWRIGKFILERLTLSSTSTGGLVQAVSEKSKMLRASLRQSHACAQVCLAKKSPHLDHKSSQMNFTVHLLVLVTFHKDEPLRIVYFS